MNTLIILVGFMGSGKTTVGKLTADRLGWRFADTDSIITERAGRSVAQIFKSDGEAYFRQLESDLCVEFGGWRRTVVATGGGIVLDPLNREHLNAAGLLICLAAPLEHIAARLDGATDRPLLASADREARMAELMRARAPIYEAIPHRIETGGLTPFAVAEKVIALWRTLS